MRSLTIDSYVIDVLLPDLVGHDRRPAAFLVYLYLLRHARTKHGRREVRASLQTIASSTGLSKSTVQNALRHLRRRALLDPNVIATTSNPTRSLLGPRAR
jgi:CRP-like cAMP-binding protein